jgi:hypothetical protein
MGLKSRASLSQNKVFNSMLMLRLQPQMIVKQKYQEATNSMEDNENHECTCGGACKEKFVKVEKKNKDNNA